MVIPPDDFVSSSATSLPEIVGNAGLQFSPDDVEGFMEGIWRLYSDQEVRNQFIKRGLMRAEEFDWKNTAEKILHTYETVLEKQ